MKTSNFTVHKMCRYAIFLLAANHLTACVTVGHEFPAGNVSSIKVGESTQNDMTNLFGTPFSTGIENGLKTWTYGDYSYNLFGNGNIDELVIRFNKHNIVSSYTFNSTKRSK
ncbi:MAG TPA: hypothetical protein DF614_04120 [Methylococcaceae bacterium]|nr:hypothetical protein [Methylococcaceae bacterium]